MVKVTFGFSETLLLFSAAMLWHNFIAGACLAGLAIFCAFCRYAMEQAEKAKKVEKQKEAAKVLNEAAGEVGGAFAELLTALSKGNNKDKSTLH
tara:strand:+ start:2164 stop:2445 length:282 start_codon:yes stop_codon:yes gene_type:complete